MTKEKEDECWQCSKPLKVTTLYVEISIAKGGEHVPGSVLDKSCITCAMDIVPGVNEDNLNAIFDWRSHV